MTVQVVNACKESQQTLIRIPAGLSKIDPNTHFVMLGILPSINVLSQHSAVFMRELVQFLWLLGPRSPDSEDGVGHIGLACSIERLSSTLSELVEAQICMQMLYTSMGPRLSAAKLIVNQDADAILALLEVCKVRVRRRASLVLNRASSWIDERIEECDTNVKQFLVVEGMLLATQSPKAALANIVVTALSHVPTHPWFSIAAHKSLLGLPIRALHDVTNNVFAAFVLERSVGVCKCTGDGVWEWRPLRKPASSHANVFKVSCMQRIGGPSVESLQLSDVRVQVCARKQKHVNVESCSVCVTRVKPGIFEVTYALPDAGFDISIWVYVCGTLVAGCPLAPRRVSCDPDVRPRDWADMDSYGER